MEVLRRLVARTQAGPLRPLWAAAYGALARAAGLLLIFPRRGTAYLRGSLARGEPVYGLSDIDLTVVVARRGETAAVRSRAALLPRIRPLSRLLGPPAVLTSGTLDAVAGRSALTLGLSQEGSGGAGSSCYGPGYDAGAVRLLERPGLVDPAQAWRRVVGRPLALPTRARDRDELRIAAWLELQHVWRSAFPFCVNPDWPQAASMCVKLVADPAGILLRLRGADPLPARSDVLRHAIRELPGHSEQLERALDWHGRLGRSDGAELATAFAAALRLSREIAGLIGAEIEPAGATAVRIEDGGEPILTRGPWRPPPGAEPRGREWRTIPLADWSDLVRRCLADSVAVAAAGDPADPALLGRLADAAPTGPQPLLESEGLIVLPAALNWRATLRSIQAAFSDPVTTALLAGRPVASFPDVPGWSIGDVARRALAENGARIAPDVEAGTVLGPGVAREELSRSIGAVRAALLMDSLNRGDPALTVTAEATLARLTSRAGCEAAASDGLELLRRLAADWAEVPREPVQRLREAARRLVPRPARGRPSRPSPSAAGRA